MKKIRIAINGAGRIGRAFWKLAHKRDDVEIVAVNDLGDAENICYLLEHDSVYGPSGLGVACSPDKKEISIDGKKTVFLSEKDPAQLPWKALDIDVVIESTGRFTSFDSARAHITAGGKRAIITAPAHDSPEGKEHPKDEGTILMGINDNLLSEKILTSNASCTTNAGSPLLSILHEALGIEKAILNTVHGYTASQSLVDSPNAKDWKEGRAAGQNIVPTSTGAALATTKAITALEGKFDGIAIRVPVPCGSIVDVTFISKRPTTTEEVNAILKKASGDTRWQGIFSVTEEPLVSSDILGNLHGSIADLSLTRVVDGNLVKVMAWYDNEMGYSNMLLQHVVKIASFI